MKRVDALEEAARRARLASDTHRAGTTIDRSMIEAAIEGVLKSLEGGNSTALVSPSAMYALVESALSTREQQQREQRETMRARAQAHGLENRVEKLRVDLGLDRNQTYLMRAILQDEQARRDQLRARVSEERETGGVAMRGILRRWAILGGVTDQAIRSALSLSQYERYKESLTDIRWGRKIHR